MGQKKQKQIRKLLKRTGARPTGHIQGFKVNSKGERIELVADRFKRISKAMKRYFAKNEFNDLQRRVIAGEDVGRPVRPHRSGGGELNGSSV